MVQGTTSDAGKTVLVAGLGRVLSRQNVKVAPFKPQNMALNSAVTTDGGEIGRAQALQAQACNTPALIDMNPVLLKPSSDIGAQVIVHGKALTQMDAAEFHQYKPKALEAVLQSFSRLTEQFNYIVVEGAGSPAEINLREGDIANMGFAEAADVPVIIIADIDRGGVFAHLVGTLDLLSPSEQNRVIGFVINRFRGDIALLQPGIDWLEKRTGKPVIGVLPYLHGLQLDAEDAINAEQICTEDALNVVIPVLPRISNHTDFDSLRMHPKVNLQWIGPSQSDAIPPADLIILPGSKSVGADLSWLRARGWEQHIAKHLRYGGKVLGVCGGYQMLGRTIADPEGIEGPVGKLQGLGYLAIDTTLHASKHLQNRDGHLLIGNQRNPINGYEIHCGQTSEHTTPLIQFSDDSYDGALEDNICGTYLHGLFDNPQSCTALLQWAGLKSNEQIDSNALREVQLNRLADSIERHLDLSQLPGFVSKAAV